MNQLKTMLENGLSYKELAKKLEHSPQLNQKSLGSLMISLIQLNKPNFQTYFHLLLQYGANPNFVELKSTGQMKIYRSLLMIACEKSNTKTVRTILSLKDINALRLDNQNQNILFYALRNTQEDQAYSISRIIIQQYPKLVYGANIHGKGPVFMATQRRSPKILDLILRNDGDPNLQLKDNGSTPLHDLLEDQKGINKRQLVQLLLKYGAKPSLKNSQGQDCYSIAKKYKFDLGQFENQIQKMKLEEKDLESEVYSQYAATKDEDIFSRTSDDFFKENLNDFSSDQEDQPVQTPMNYEKLGAQIQRFMAYSQKQYFKAWEDIKHIYRELEDIGKKMTLKIDIIGSYATKLWTPESDIDIVFVNHGENLHVNLILEKIYNILQELKETYEIQKIYLNSQIKFPNITMILSRKLGRRKLDITVFQFKNNGEKYVSYIRKQLESNSFIKPLFYIMKRILKNFKLNNPSRGGIKTYGLFLMLVIALKSLPASSIGQAFTYFVYYFAYCFNYEEYIDKNGQYCMKLNLIDPINHTNNAGGKNTDTQAVRNMFKVLDYGLRLKTQECEEEILPYLFQLNRLFIE